LRVARLTFTAIAAFRLSRSPPRRALREPQVAGLQIALRQHGLYRGPNRRRPGPKTVRAVRAFQRKHGLTVDVPISRDAPKLHGKNGVEVALVPPCDPHSRARPT
jgi:peptidoglycan hydrolase-like protein with peptidoglycan-binding domain